MTGTEVREFMDNKGGLHGCETTTSEHNNSRKHEEPRGSTPPNTMRLPPTRRRVRNPEASHREPPCGRSTKSNAYTRSGRHRVGMHQRQGAHFMGGLLGKARGWQTQASKRSKDPVRRQGKKPPWSPKLTKRHRRRRRGPARHHRRGGRRLGDSSGARQGFFGSKSHRRRAPRRGGPRHPSTQGRHDVRAPPDYGVHHVRALSPGRYAPAWSWPPSPPYPPSWVYRSGLQRPAPLHGILPAQSPALLQVLPILGSTPHSLGWQVRPQQWPWPNNCRSVGAYKPQVPSVRLDLGHRHMGEITLDLNVGRPPGPERMGGRLCSCN